VVGLAKPLTRVSLNGEQLRYQLYALQRR